MKFPRGIEVISSVLVVDGGKILLYKSPKWGDAWGIPGGHINPGEILSEAAKREVEEETGLRVEIKNMIRAGEIINDPSFHRPAHFIYFHFLGNKKGGELKGNMEVSEFSWFAPKDALTLKFMPGTKETIQAFCESL